ncbi:MAG TPA: hypothetical protein VHA13_05515, partial [Gammaproteobacteria bacterium]|nr:hypothetical protein [Gammaproteobacteria bacterium]
IITAGASATRAADIPQLTGAAATAARAAKAAFFQTSSVTGGSFPRLLEWGGGAFIDYPNTISIRISNIAEQAVGAFGSGTNAGLAKAALGFDATSMTAVANGGSKATTANSISSNTGTIYLGNRAAGDRALNGYMQQFYLSPTKGIFDTITSP